MSDRLPDTARNDVRAHSERTRRQSALEISYNEARGHLTIVAVIGWLCVFAFTGLGAGERSVFGPLKWADFVHFYAIGDAARTGNTSILYDADALHASQVARVPESRGDYFLPVYGPQTSLIFAPLSALPYVAAGAVWALLTLTAYLVTCFWAWRPALGAAPDWTMLVAAALGFPPIWMLVGYGQTTMVLLIAFAGGCAALERGRALQAGVVLSLVAIKPQWGLVLASVALLAREWRLIAGVLLGVCVQGLVAVVFLGSAVVGSYGAALWHTRGHVDKLEPALYKLHSLRAVTQILPLWADWCAWAVLSVAITACAWWTWRRRALPLRLRFAVLVLASALVNPHLSIYDVAVLSLPLLWIGAWLVNDAREAKWYWQGVYWFSAALLLPTAALLSVQASTFVLTYLFGRVCLLPGMQVRSRPG